MIYIYPLGSGSTWNDNELYLSMHSILKHSIEPVTGFFVVGENPRCQMDNLPVTVIKCRFNSKSRIKDVISKLIFALPVINAKEYVIMSDDIFALNKFKASEFKPYYDRTVKERLKGVGGWYEYQKNACKNKDYSDLCFSTHKPFIVHFDGLFKDCLDNCLELNADPFTYYGNEVAKIRPDKIEKNKNIKLIKPTTDWVNNKYDWISIDDSFLSLNNKEILYKKCVK
jgi:hypothetical protein